MKIKMVFVATTILSVILVGCATSPVPTYYSLDLEIATPAPTESAPSVSVVLASLPDALDRPQMLSRSGYEVLISEQNRWVEPLRRAMPRVLASEIGVLLNSSQVSGGMGLRNPDYRVLLDVQRFDVLTSHKVEVDILWRIEGKGGSSAGRSTLQEPVVGSSVSAQVEAQRRGLARVAGDIATQISKLSTPVK